MSWKTVALGDVCKVIAGQSPEGKYYNNDGNGLPFYQGKKDFGSVYIKSPSVWTTEVTKEATKGDILMSVRAPVGPVNISTENICIGRGLAAIRATEKIDKSYLFNFLLSIEKDLVGSSGAVFNSINKGQIENLQTPLPPLPIQQKIVTKLDAIFAEIDKATAAAETNAKNAEALFQSYLTQVFERGDEGWKRIKLKDIAEYFNGLTYSPKNVNEDGTVVLRSSNVQSDKILLNDIVRVNSTIKEKLYVKNGDILMCSRNGSKRLVGKTATIGNLEERMTFGTFMMIIRSESNFFIEWFFKSDLFKRQISSGENTMINQITRYMLDEIVIPLPDITTQKSISSKISNLYNTSHLLKSSYIKKIDELSLYKQSILKQAFNGELVNE